MRMASSVIQGMSALRACRWMNRTEFGQAAELSIHASKPSSRSDARHAKPRWIGLKYVFHAFANFILEGEGKANSGSLITRPSEFLSSRTIPPQRTTREREREHMAHFFSKNVQTSLIALPYRNFADQNQFAQGIQFFTITLCYARTCRRSGLWECITLYTTHILR